MNTPDVFKYGSLVSIPLFSIIALSLIRGASHFSFRKHTVSKSVNYLKHPIHMIVFRMNFIIKALLDFGFILYVLNHFKISLASPFIWSLIVSALLFGSLAYFIEGKHTVLHQIIIYSSGVLWAVGQLYIARLTGDGFFIQLTNIMVIVPIIIAFGFMFANKTNVFVQALCMSIWYIWLLIFVFGYL